MRRRSSIASKSPVNCPANHVRRAVRGDADGAGSGWGVWDHPRDAVSAVRAVAAIRLRRDTVIISPPWARSRQAHARENAAVAQKAAIICLLYVFNQRSRQGILTRVGREDGGTRRREPCYKRTSRVVA